MEGVRDEPKVADNRKESEMLLVSRKESVCVAASVSVCTSVDVSVLRDVAVFALLSDPTQESEAESAPDTLSLTITELDAEGVEFASTVQPSNKKSKPIHITTEQTPCPLWIVIQNNADAFSTESSCSEEK